MNFVESYKNTKIDTDTAQELLHDEIDAWHNSESKLELHQYLGIPKELFIKWATGRISTPGLFIRLKDLP